MSSFPFDVLADTSGLAISHATVIHEFVKSLDGGTAIASVLASMLARRAAGSLEGPGEADRLVSKFGDLVGLAFGHLRDGGMFALPKALQEATICVGIEAGHHPRLFSR